ncbi:segregation and condensation protein A [Actinomyces qiguomingii]|uniref:segregation and condensation protein A n=1 Tax=Actinomyces qiguomingii TaxID=2057800 RepID=UPI000CA055FD|nr:ScpA family protein [Actinomyces qiguomingii]
MSPENPAANTPRDQARPPQDEPVPSGPAQVPGFNVNLPQFEGPFDLLLTLIARKRLDITELALAEVTDEFIAYMRADWDLGQASEFLVVASTLLALKAHRLLPHDPEETDEDMELLEARDLLFARLLQYRAYKEAAAAFRTRAENASRTHPRAVGLPPELAALLPRLVFTAGAQDLARIAAEVFSRPRDPGVQTVHLHERVPVGEQLRLLAERLRRRGTLTFKELTADTDRTAVVVARFLAVLILYRQGGVDLAQDAPMEEITITWRGEVEMAAMASPELEEEFA